MSNANDPDYIEPQELMRRAQLGAGEVNAGPRPRLRRTPHMGIKVPAAALNVMLRDCQIVPLTVT